MTKAELIKALEPFGDGQIVFVNLRSRDYECGCQVIIHSIDAVPPWRGGTDDKSNWLIGLNADADNSESRIVQSRELWTKPQ